jgi:hypothetical protein
MLAAPPPPPSYPPPPPPVRVLTIRRDVPWFEITVRPEIGTGGGGLSQRWDAPASSNMYYNEESASLYNVGVVGLTTEAFFMPDFWRRFIISPMLTFNGGSGTFGRSFGMFGPNSTGANPQSVRFGDWIMALGLGSQWYFGAQQRTNLYLMAHLGGGFTTLSTAQGGSQHVSAPLSTGYVDVTIGSMHRFNNGFLLGGSLVFSDQQFGGPAGNNGYWGNNSNGEISLLRLGLMLGYAVK